MRDIPPTTSKVRGRERYGAPTEKRDRRDVTELPEVKEITILNLNIRGLNSAAKQVAIDNVVKQVDPHVICLNETKLQYELFLDNFWSHQTMHRRNGGCWTAASTKTRLTLVKALGNYLCWTRLTTGSKQVQILNCYL